MDANVKTILFYFGIIAPTVITVGFFIIFLICWFRCDLKQRLMFFRGNSQNKSTASHTERDGKSQ